MGESLVLTHDGAWVLHGGAIAHVPSEGIKNQQLTDEAREALINAGFPLGDDMNCLALTVLTATSCNLGCGYCFQNIGENPANPFAPKRIEKKFLDHDSIEKIRRYVEHRLEVEGFNSISLLLFGGEPLLNKNGCYELLDSLSTMNLVGASMTTNAVLLTAEVAAELEKRGLRRAQVSFDGYASDHDSTRADHAGRGSYEQIMRNLRACAAAGVGIQFEFRVNMTSTNVSHLHRLVEDLGSLKFPSPPEIYVAPVDDIGVGYHNAIPSSADLSEDLKSILGSAIEVGLVALPFLNKDQGCPYCDNYGAGGAVINADGKLYSCWRTAGQKGWEVGSVEDGFTPIDQVRDRWVSCHFNSSKSGLSQGNGRELYDELNRFILEKRFRTN